MLYYVGNQTSIYIVFKKYMKNKNYHTKYFAVIHQTGNIIQIYFFFYTLVRCRMNI